MLGGKWIALPKTVIMHGCVGAVVGGGLDLGVQLLLNGGNFSEVSWKQVGASAALGAVGAGIGSTLQKAGQVRRAYQNGLNAARNTGLSPKQAFTLRRNLGASLKRQTPQPFRSLIYRRNINKYGDKLGPAFNADKFSNVTKSLTDTNALLNVFTKLPSRGLGLGGGIAGGILGNQSGNYCGNP